MTDDTRHVAAAQQWAKKSEDPKAKVGCVIVQTDPLGFERTLGVGWNMPPDGISVDYRDRETKLEVCLHAEQIALFAAQGNRSWNRRYTTALYCTTIPCAQCAALAIHCGVRRVVCGPPIGRRSKERWGRSWELAEQLYRAAGVDFVQL